MKKILYVINSFAFGGAEKVVTDYITMLNPNIFEIKAVSINKNTNSIYDDYLKKQTLR